ncbi:MAG: hypothetical protein ACI4RA_09590 [Kiritimatiellia bacterium]
MNGIKQKIRKLGFTLMEVNLAIFIMATGVLAMVSLYPLGYRENQQSRDDVWAASEADRIFNQLHAALSERSIKWNDWLSAVRSLKNSAGNWELYCDANNGYVPKNKSQINSLARAALSGVAGIARQRPSDLNLDSKRAYAVVVQPGRITHNGQTVEDYSRVAISMRIARNAGALFAQPVYFTEIHFQGDQERQ